MVKPVIFQVVGYQNSGKTTFVNKLLTQLKLEGFKTATIKHHGHGGKPKIVEDKDSSHHISAGAVASIVEGDGRMLLQTENLVMTLEDKIDLLRIFKPDVIVIEGHKYENYPKFVLLRNKGDHHLLKELKNIIGILYKESQEMEYSVPEFFRDDPDSIKWIIRYVDGQVEIL